MPFAAGPQITFAESKQPQKLKKTYYKRILNSYRLESELIYKQFKDYVKEIEKPNFKILIKLPMKNV